MQSNTIRYLAGAVILLSCAQTAHAGAYGTLGLSVEDIQPVNNFENFTGTGINARLGYNFGRYFGLEAEGQVGLSGQGDNPSFLDSGEIQQNQTYDYNGAWALYLRPQIPVSDNLSLSLRAGFGVKYFDRTVDNPFVGMSDPSVLVIEDTSTLLHLALGAGVEYSFGEEKVDSLRLDFTRRDHPGDRSDVDDAPFANNQMTISYARKF